MSEEEKPRIDEKPWRYFKDHKGPVRMNCRLGIRKATFGELREHFAERYPEVDFDSLEVGGLQLHWEDAPTAEELARLDRQNQLHETKREAWERQTYERLKAKFEPVSAFEDVNHG